MAASDLRSGFTVVGSDTNERSAVFGDGDDEGTLEDASVFVPPPVAGTPTKSAATDLRAPGASDPRSPLNMDFLARRAESQRALDESADYAAGLIEAGAVADGAGVAERSALGLQPLPPGEAIWASPSGRWEPCTALLQVSEDPIMHLVRQSAGGARGAVHLLLPEWAVRPFAAQEINVQHPFRERPLHVPWAPSHFHHCDAHGDGTARWLPVWVPPPSHPMHKALWSGAGLGADGVNAGHLGMVSSDLRCSVVQASRLLTVEEGAARGISLNEVAASTVGRRVKARSTSVLLEVHEAARLGSPNDDGGKGGGFRGGWSDASERESALGTAFGQHSHVGHHTQGVNMASGRSAEPSFQRNLPPSSVVVGAGLSAVAANERQVERDEGLCDNLMKLRGRVLEGKLTRGQLRAHAMQFSGHTRIVMEDVPELARVLADDEVPSTPVHAGEFELLLGCLRSHFDTYKGPPAPPLAPEGGGALGGTPIAPPPPPAPPGLPAVPGTPLGSRAAGARGLRVVVVPDDELSAGGAAPSSDVSDVTGPSMGGATASWVAVTPSALDLDTPSRGTMMPGPAVSSALGAAPPGAPSPQDRIAAASEERARAAQRSADAAERLAQHAGSTARDSRVTADAVERKEAKSKPNAFRQAYETRRWVACNGGDHVGYIGRDERVDAPVEDELDTVLGTDAQAAEARSRIQIPIPPERRTAGGRLVDRGGLWFAFMQGSDWYSSVQTAVSKPADAFHQFGLTFQVTHKAIECFGRVAFGPPHGITPDWTPYKDPSQLRLCATLCETPTREPTPELISSKDSYKKACRAFGTMFPPCYGTEVKRQWDLLLDRIFALAEPKKWSLATMRRFVDMCLCDFSTRIRAEINKVFRLNQGLARDHGGVALEPTVNELMARAKVINPTTGLRFIGCPHHVSFSIAIRDGAGGELGPLGTELAHVVMQADVGLLRAKVPN